MKRVMLDLETRDTSSDAAIVSIGAVEFDERIELPGLGREFYVAIKEDKQTQKWGRTTSAANLRWWEQQSPEARAVLTDPDAVYLDTALNKFAEWLAGQHIEIWGNGSDFDNVILGNAYAATGSPAPWAFRMNRCFRTLKNLNIPLGPGEGIERVGTHHNALDDAKYQAHYAIAYLRRLSK